MNAYCQYVETKRYLLVLLADEDKRNRKGREEVAAQLHDPHRVTLRTRGALYYLLNIPPDVRIKYTFFKSK